MGKKIIIKGADFSENCIELEPVLLLDRTEQFSSVYSKSTTVPAVYPTADGDYEALQNHVITAIEFRPMAAGTLSIIKTTTLSGGTNTKVGEITVLSGDIGNVTKYNVGKIRIGPNEIIALGLNTDSVTWKYCGANDYTPPTKIYTGLNEAGYKLRATSSLAVNWYGV